MSDSLRNEKRVLAIDPSAKGFGFAVLEGQWSLIDRGGKEMNGDKGNKNAQCLRKVEDLIDFYLPDVLAVEDYAGKGSHRCKRVQKLIKLIAELAKKKRVKVRKFSRDQIKEVFANAGARTKYQIAAKITECFPQLIPLMPRNRLPWMPEDNRMNVFDAVSLALTYLREKSN